MSIVRQISQICRNANCLCDLHVSVCAHETTPLCCWLGFEALFLKCLWIAIVCWMLLVMYHFHFLLSVSNVDEIKFCENWAVFQRNSVAAKILMALRNCSQLVTGTLIITKTLNYWDSCKLIPMDPTEYLSWDKQVWRLQKILHSLATRVPRIVLQRAEEIFSAVRGSIVSVSCLCAQTIILLLYVSSLGQRN
jgi:hypothetical protein